MTREEASGWLRKGFNCSQAVLMTFADELGYDEEELARIASAFGGGMARGDTCGCVTGALMALGLRFGNGDPGEGEKKAEIRKRALEFESAFAGRCGSLLCRELIGFDFAVPGEREKAMASGVMQERCPGFVRAAVEETEKQMEE